MPKPSIFFHCRCCNRSDNNIKKLRKKFVIFLIAFLFLELVPNNFSSAADLAVKLTGRILLQVEDAGQAWYVDPASKERVFLGRPADAFRIMRELGLGISEKDYNSFKGKAPSKLSGKILIRSEAKGEAYYVNPTDLKLYYLGRSSDAFEIMRKQGIGITNKDLVEVPVFQEYAEQTANICSTKPVNSASLIKTYHLLDLTDGFGVLPVKDGGYLLTGDTIPAAGMAAPKPFIIKTDAKGNLAWSRWFSSQSMALGELSSRHIGRLAAETTDGNIITAIDALDFVDENVKELYGDILVTKLDKKGIQLWSIMLGDYSIDRPRKLWALPGGGVLLLARFMKTGYGTDVADTAAVPTYSVLIEIDKNGKVQSSKKMSWDALDMERLADGGFIALADINVSEAKQAENILGPEVVPHALPTIIKLDRNLNVAWAKSMEMIPSEINAPTSYASSTLTIGKTVIRLAGGDFRAVQPTPDNGFIAIGFDNLALTQGIYGGVKLSDASYYKPRPFIAVKVDASGKYLWTKKLTNSLVFSISANDFQVVKTVDGQFVIMQDVIRDSSGVEAKSQAAAQKRKAFLDKCKELNSDCLDPANIIAGAKQAADEDNAAMKVLVDAQAGNIELIKVDADFNPRWIKKFDAERNLSGYGIAPTADKGVAVAASLLTTKQHMVMLSLEPYKEATLIKVDANGNASGCADVSDQPQAAVEDQSPYLVMQNMNVGTAGNMKLNINKKVKEKVSAINNTARDICQYKKAAVAPLCSYLAPSAVSAPSGQPATPAAKTWALINYENTKETAADGEKNKSINEELLPILNQVYDNQVKLKDSMKSMWLTYIFPRPATLADVEAVQKYYEELGYKIDESESGRLFVTKVGRTLHMTFSIQNSMVGKLEVLF